MTRVGGWGLGCVLVVALLAGCAGPRDTPAAGSGVSDLPIAGGAVQRVLYKAPPEPKAVVVLLTGGDGTLGIDGAGGISRAGNFLIRSRERWLAEGIGYAIPDVPSDRHDLLDQRQTAAYGEVLRTIVRHVRAQTTAPIWLVGTSNGTNAAINGGVRLRPDEIAGIVLTSTVSRPGGQRYTENVLGADLSAIAVPVLIASHRRDACFSTPPADADAIRRGLTRSPRTEIMLFDGGLPPRSIACEAFAEHGFYGIEPEVITRLAAWIKA
jgi:hypothetical protein